MMKVLEIVIDELPVSCEKCRFCNDYRTSKSTGGMDCYILNDDIDIIIGGHRRPANCPLKERMGDRNKKCPECGSTNLHYDNEVMGDDDGFSEWYLCGTCFEKIYIDDVIDLESDDQ